MEDREKLISLLRQEEIIYKQPVKLTSGQPAEFYVDVKKSYGNPEIKRLMAKLISRQISPQATCLASSGYGGIPLASSVSDITSLPLILVRDTPKKHGKGGFIDGYVPNQEDRVCLIDDVLTTGGSLIKLEQRISLRHAKILEALVVVKRGEPKLPFPFNYLITAEDLL